MNVIIWDRDEKPEYNKYTKNKIVLWKNYTNLKNRNIISIPSLIEKKANELKVTYLKWIYALSRIKINNKKLYSELQIRPGLSYWWMTLLNEKCNIAKSPQIVEALRLLAFKKWIDKKKIFKIHIHSKKINLLHALKPWCERNNIALLLNKKPAKDCTKKYFKNFLESLKIFLFGLAWFFKESLKIRLDSKSRHTKWMTAKGRFTIISYFFNLEAKKLNRGIHESNYWGNLPKIIKQKHGPVNWLQIYVRNRSVLNFKQAEKQLVVLNNKSKSCEIHTFLESFYSFSVFKNTLTDFLKVNKTGLAFLNKEKFKFAKNINLTEILSSDLKTSFFGKEAFKNLLYLNLFERAFKILPIQKKGIYLQENMGWEQALIYAWKAAGHKQIIGVPHSTVRFWDLRYFNDPRIFRYYKKNMFMKPDVIAVNGYLMKKMLKQSGIPNKVLKNSEALRFQHISNKKTKVRSEKVKKNLTLLIVTDYLAENSKKMIDFISKIKFQNQKNLKIIIKPHPACCYNYNQVNKLKYFVSNKPLSELFKKTHAVFTSSTTSAAAEALAAGLKTYIYYNASNLNLSPLAHTRGAKYISSSQELSDELNKLSNINYFLKPKRLFFLNKKLPKWTSILKN